MWAQFLLTARYVLINNSQFLFSLSCLVLMECYLEHLRAALYVLVLFDTLEACIDAMVINQHGANVHTLLKNQLALKGNGKFQKKRTTNTLCRLSIFKWL